MPLAHRCGLPRRAAFSTCLAPAPQNAGGYGFYNQEAFINFRGQYLRGAPLTHVTGTAERGGRVITVADARRLVPGGYVALLLSDTKAAPLTKFLMGSGRATLPLGRVTPGRSPLVRFVVRVVKVTGATVELERPLPFNIRPEYSPALVPRTGTVYESGVEGLAFQFQWRPYSGHHYEDGFNGIEFKEVSGGGTAEGGCCVQPLLASELPRFCRTGVRLLGQGHPRHQSRQRYLHRQVHGRGSAWVPHHADCAARPHEAKVHRRRPLGRAQRWVGCCTAEAGGACSAAMLERGRGSRSACTPDYQETARHPAPLLTPAAAGSSADVLVDGFDIE